MPIEPSNYPQPKDTPQDNRTCIVCEFPDNDPAMGQFVPIGKRPDNKQPLWCHNGECLGWLTKKYGPEFDNLFRSVPQTTLTASREEPENIWAFAAKFKYFTANATDGLTDNSMTYGIDNELPAAATAEKPAKAVQTDVKVKTDSTGTYQPPTTF